MARQTFAENKTENIQCNIHVPHLGRVFESERCPGMRWGTLWKKCFQLTLKFCFSKINSKHAFWSLLLWLIAILDRIF